MKGRKRKPNALRALQGNAGRRALPPEPKMRSGVPTCPDHLSSVASEEWKRIVVELKAADLLKLCDRAALAAYCCLYGRWVDAEGQIASRGMTYEAAGYIKKNPMVGIAQDAMALMKAYLTEFGLTPASRSKATPNAPERDVDPMDSFLDGQSPAFGVGPVGKA